jgi:hypothetical protein
MKVMMLIAKNVGKKGFLASLSHELCQAMAKALAHMQPVE